MLHKVLLKIIAWVVYYAKFRARGPCALGSKSHPFRSGFVLGSVPSTASALLPFTALGLIALGGAVVATLSATACTEELGAEIIVAHITRAVRGVAIAHRRITVQHFSLPHLFCSLYLYYSIVYLICQEEILKFL